MEELMSYMRQAANMIDRTVSIVDERGITLASTDESLKGELFDLPIVAVLSDYAMHVSESMVFRRLDLTNYPDLVLCVEGSDRTAQSYLSLLYAWLSSVTKSGSRMAEKETYLKNLLIENELPGDIPLKAKNLKIPYVAHRVVFLIKFTGTEISDVISVLSSMYPNRNCDFILPFNQNAIVLLKEVGEKADHQEVDAIAEKILNTLTTELMAKVRIGIGVFANTLRDLAKSYREANLAMTVGSVFEPEIPVMRYDQLGLGRLIYQLPETLCTMFLDEVFPEDCYEQIDADTLNTIDIFFENNLNGSETSRQLYVHRNTLVYRLDKTQKITGLDLRKFDDAVMFKLAAMVRQYLEYKIKQDQQQIKKSGTWWNR